MERENSENYILQVIFRVLKLENDFEHTEYLTNASDWISLIQESFQEANRTDFIEIATFDTAVDILSVELGRMDNYSIPRAHDKVWQIENNLNNLRIDDILELYDHIFGKNLQPIVLNDGREKEYCINEDDRFESVSIQHIKEILLLTFENQLNTQLELLKVRLFYLPKDKSFYKKIHFDTDKETIDELIRNVTGQ